MDYAAEAADILPDFIENGQPITIRRPVTTVFNPGTGKYDTPSAKLDGAITAMATTITLKNFVGTWVATKGVVKIGAEAIFYAALAGNQITGCTRGAQGTAPAAADDLAPASLLAQGFPGHALASGYHAKLIDGTRIKQGDQQFTVAASGLGVEPTVSDKLLDAAGGVWGIESCQAVAPGGVALLYRVQGRK